MITLADYWMGRDALFPLAMTPAIAKAAATTVDLANRLLAEAALHGVQPGRNPATKSAVNSGWRPPSINAGTPGAAPNSKHMTGMAIDICDPDGDVDDWLVSVPGLDALGRLGLWLEHPATTKGWAHVQTVPPRSGNRVFYP